MGTGEEVPPQDTTQRRVGAKRKRETRPAAAKARQTGTPNVYSRRTPPREEPRDPPQPADDEDGDQSPPRKLKRPGGGSRLAAANREAAERERRLREEETRRTVAERQVAGAEIIANHYNAVPERGREWRQSESKISGLRSLNNWIKSTLIQKFSQPEIPVPDMKVLDMACGKGGDLGKWKKAPQIPVLYVGCDIARVSIGDAQKRYEEDLAKSRGRPRMEAQFYVHDTFGRPLADIPVIRSVGFNPNSGPGGVIQGGMMSGGFDVVSMMFALHYSFESEVLARGMLKNVSGALKKGGRFIGVMPNSDVISAHIKTLLSKEAASKTLNNPLPPARNGASSSVHKAEENDGDDWDPEKPSEPNAGADDDEWDPEKPSDGAVIAASAEDDDDWDPEKPSEPTQEVAAEAALEANQPATNGASHTPDDSFLPDLEWKNDIYSVRFPRNQPLTKKSLPRDGVFRPPFGWKYHYHLVEAVEAPEFVVPWEAFRALAENYGLELMYRKGFREVFEDESTDRDLGMLAERMKVLDRDRSKPNGGLLVTDQEMEAASFYHAFCFYKT